MHYNLLINSWKSVVSVFTTYREIKKFCILRKRCLNVLHTIHNTNSDDSLRIKHKLYLHDNKIYICNSKSLAAYVSRVSNENSD
jgi:hypothetical protein